MRHEQVELGFSTADAEDVHLNFDGADLALTFVDWRAIPRRHVFREVLAYRWGQTSDGELPRDDATFELHDSPWLAREALASGVDPRRFAHYVLAFNAHGLLEVLAAREGQRA